MSLLTAGYGWWPLCSEDWIRQLRGKAFKGVLPALYAYANIVFTVLAWDEDPRLKCRKPTDNQLTHVVIWLMFSQWNDGVDNVHSSPWRWLIRNLERYGSSVIRHFACTFLCHMYPSHGHIHFESSVILLHNCAPLLGSSAPRFRRVSQLCGSGSFRKRAQVVFRIALSG